eukprot:10077973-Lingulodinium_polyedra.AAC.1
MECSSSSGPAPACGRRPRRPWRQWSRLSLHRIVRRPCPNVPTGMAMDAWRICCRGSRALS